MAPPRSWCCSCRCLARGRASWQRPAAPCHCAQRSPTRGPGISWAKGSQGPPPCPSAGQTASRLRDPFLKATVFWTLWVWRVRIPWSRTEPGLSKWIPHPVSKGSGHSSPRPEGRKWGPALPVCDPRQGPGFQSNFLTCAPAVWLALRTRGRNLGGGHPWSSGPWTSTQRPEWGWG